MAESGTIGFAQLSSLTGLAERRLRELVSENWLPKPVDGRYQLVPTIQGLLRYYRERVEHREIQDNYDSIAACAGATGIPVTAMKHAKRNGCPAFRGSRVYLAPLIRWLHGPANGSNSPTRMPPPSSR